MKLDSQSYSDNASFAYPPSLLPRPSSYTDLRNSFYQDYPFNARDWQSQATVASASQAAPPSIPSHSLPTFEAFQNTNYGQQFYSSVCSVSSNRHAASVSYSTYNAIHQSYSNQIANLLAPSLLDTYPVHPYAQTTPSLPEPSYSSYSSAFPDFYNASNYDPRLHLRSSLAETTSYALTNPDAILQNDTPSSVSVDGGNSITSSLENNVSWSSVSQEMLNFLNSDLSYPTSSPETSVRNCESGDTDLSGLLPEFQFSNNQALQSSHEPFATNNQIQKDSSVAFNDCQRSLVPHSCHSCSICSFYKSPFAVSTDNAFSNFANQSVPVFQNHPPDKILQSQNENDTTLCIPSNSSPETDDLDLVSEGDLVINEDTVMEDTVLGEINDNGSTLSQKNGTDQVYEALNLQTASPLMFSLNSQDVESVFQATESSQSAFTQDTLTQEAFTQESFMQEYENPPMVAEEVTCIRSDGSFKAATSNLIEQQEYENPPMVAEEVTCIRSDGSFKTATSNLIEQQEYENPPMVAEEVSCIQSDGSFKTATSNLIEHRQYENPPMIAEEVTFIRSDGSFKTATSNLIEHQSEKLQESVLYAPYEKKDGSSVISAGKAEIRGGPHCPVVMCNELWDPTTQPLDKHLRMCHPSSIISNEKYLLPFEFSFASLREGVAQPFIMEANNLLLIISAIKSGGKIISFLQYASKSIDSSEETAMCLGCALEAINSNQAPVGWSGEKVNSYATSSEDLVSSNQCLVLDPKDFGSTISLYAQVFFPPAVKEPTPQRPIVRKRSQRGCKKKLILDL